MLSLRTLAITATAAATVTFGIVGLSGMGPDGTMGKGGMGAIDGMKDKPATAGDVGMHHQMMDQRM